MISMRKWTVLSLLMAAACIILSACITITPVPKSSGTNTGKDTREEAVMLKTGMYYQQDPEIGGLNTPYIYIDPERQTFSTARGPAYSFALFGYYQTEGSIYTLKTEEQDPKTIVLRALSEEEIQVVSLEGFDPEKYEIWMQEGDIFAMGEISPVWYEQVLSADEALALARRKNVPVIEEMQCTSGSEAWDAFYRHTEAGKPLQIIVAKYYTLDKEHMAPELYEEEKDLYPMLIFYRVWFDGEKYTVTTRISSEEESDSEETYQYLMHYTGEMPPSARYSTYDYYVLVNDDSVTWEDIEHGMLSSQFGAWIPHCAVYQDCR